MPRIITRYRCWGNASLWINVETYVSFRMPVTNILWTLYTLDFLFQPNVVLSQSTSLSSPQKIFQVTGQNQRSRLHCIVLFDLSDLMATAVAVLAERNMMSAEIEADYMWGLIHPSFLVGDARYQLTTFSSAVNQLKNFRKLAESRMSICRGSFVSGKFWYKAVFLDWSD